MKILQYYPGIIPAKYYGGTERVIFSLCKGLVEYGHDITLAANEGSYIDGVKILNIKDEKVINKIINNFDIVHYHVTPPFIPEHPYLVTIHGNMKKGEGRLLNTVFLSNAHANKHGSSNYIYNGLDLSIYKTTPNIKDYFTFLSKVSWGLKGAKIAVELAKKLKLQLIVAGGKIWWSSYKGIKSYGFVDDNSKAEILRHSKALLFPIQWAEPFGLVVVEALASGSPVITFNQGSMPEIVGASLFKDWNIKIGYVCKNINEFIESINKVSEIDRNACSEYAKKYFNHYRMTDNYIAVYNTIIRKGDFICEDIKR